VKPFRIVKSVAGAVVEMWVRRRLRGRCWHHDDNTGDSWVRKQLIDMGRRKLIWCTKCWKTEIV